MNPAKYSVPNSLPCTRANQTPNSTATPM
jgi:hypothetical protein